MTLANREVMYEQEDKLGFSSNCPEQQFEKTQVCVGVGIPEEAGLMRFALPSYQLYSMTGKLANYPCNKNNVPLRRHS